VVAPAAATFTEVAEKANWRKKQARTIIRLRMMRGLSRTQREPTPTRPTLMRVSSQIVRGTKPALTCMVR
jgi:hypothetical protein